MADPTPYEVDYSFSGFQANSPTTPLPAPRVDTEFANIATAITALVNSIRDVRRSDGALKNQIVTYDSLALGLQLTFDPTNGDLVAAAVTGAQASAATALASQTAASGFADDAEASAVFAAASASSVNLSLFLTKAGNLTGIDDIVAARANIGLGSAAIANLGTGPSAVVQLDGAGKLPAFDGSQLTNTDPVPAGMLGMFPFTAAPSGWLALSGQLISRVTYARLYAAAAASGNILSEAAWATSTGAFSTGDLSTTFRLPDARGEFFRGYDNSRGVDAARVIGSNQAGANAPHTHTVSGGTIAGVGASSYSGPGVSGPTGTSAIVIDSQGTEARPRNIPMLVCIKF